MKEACVFNTNLSSEHKSRTVGLVGEKYLMKCLGNTRNAFRHWSPSFNSKQIISER